MIRNIIIALVLALLVSAGWAMFHKHNPRAENIARFESDMTEALVQGIMKEMDEDKPKFYFVAFGEERTDPSRLFMARFATHVPQVRGVSSACMLRNGQWQETSSGRTGVTIEILRLRKMKPGNGEALVRFPKLPEGRNRFLYRMIEAGGQWSIKYKLLTK